MASQAMGALDAGCVLAVKPWGVPPPYPLN